MISMMADEYDGGVNGDMNTTLSVEMLHLEAIHDGFDGAIQLGAATRLAQEMEELVDVSISTREEVEPAISSAYLLVDVAMTSERTAVAVDDSEMEPVAIGQTQDASSALLADVPLIGGEFLLIDITATPERDEREGNEFTMARVVSETDEESVFERDCLFVVGDETTFFTTLGTTVNTNEAPSTIPSVRPLLPSRGPVTGTSVMPVNQQASAAPMTLPIGIVALSRVINGVSGTTGTGATTLPTPVASVPVTGRARAPVAAMAPTPSPDSMTAHSTAVAMNGVRASTPSTLPRTSSVASVSSAARTTLASSRTTVRTTRGDPSAMTITLSATQMATFSSGLSATTHARGAHRAAVASAPSLDPSQGQATSAAVTSARLDGAVSNEIPTSSTANAPANEASRSAATRDAARPTTTQASVAPRIGATTRSPSDRVEYWNFTPDDDESQPELVIFGSPRVFQSAGEYDVRLLDAELRVSRMDEPVHPGSILGMSSFETFVMRPNIVLTNTLASMSPNPLLTPQDPVDPATKFAAAARVPTASRRLRSVYS